MHRYRLEVLSLSEVRWKSSSKFFTQCNHHLNSLVVKPHAITELEYYSQKREKIINNLQLYFGQNYHGQISLQIPQHYIILCYFLNEVDDDEVKDAFYDQLESTTAQLMRSDI
jgi:hypothetical protein